MDGIGWGKRKLKRQGAELKEEKEPFKSRKIKKNRTGNIKKEKTEGFKKEKQKRLQKDRLWTR